MITLAFPANELDLLRETLWTPEIESAAILLCTPVSISPVDWRLIVREIHIAPPEAYEERTAVSVKLNAGFGLPFEKRARQNRWSLIYCHTHPHQTSRAEFSHIDDEAEIALGRYANARSPGVPHGALVFSADGLKARCLGGQEPFRVVQVGQNVRSYANTELDELSRFDRQVRAFGADGQARIRSTRVAIVGLGGTGSLVAQQLAHLGVEEFILIDHDRVDVTNLNRTVGTSETVVGSPKVDVAAAMIKHIRPGAKVIAVEGDIADDMISRKVLTADFIFSCTDSHASRHVINQIAFQYLIPAIDMGVAINPIAGKGVQFAGHIKALAPGLGCLWCLNSIDSQQVRREMMTAEHRAVDPYFSNNVGVTQPSVITLNGTVASLAGTMFLSMVAGVDAPARYLVYDGNRQRVAGVQVEAAIGCNFCGADSTILMGDEAPLPVRRHAES